MRKETKKTQSKGPSTRTISHTNPRTICCADDFPYNTNRRLHQILNWTQFNLLQNIFAFLFREISFLPSFGSSGANHMRIRTGNRTAIHTRNRIAWRSHIFFSFSPICSKSYGDSHGKSYECKLLLRIELTRLSNCTTYARYYSDNFSVYKQLF
jgi:hypothetical protein